MSPDYIAGFAEVIAQELDLTPQQVSAIIERWEGQREGKE